MLSFKHQRVLRFGKMQAVAGVFLLILGVLIVNQRNVTYDAQSRRLGLLESAKAPEDKRPDGKECLILWEEGDEMSGAGLREIEAVLCQMRVGYETCECREFEKKQLAGCKKAVLSVTHLELLGENLADVMDWVREGGDLMLLYPPETGGVFQWLAKDLGIVMLGEGMATADVLRFSDSFMIGGTAHDFPVTDPYESSLAAALTKDCEVFLETAGERPTPLVWRRKLDEGTIVVDNLGFMEKAYRGIHCAAWSLLGDTAAWPVINAAVFYIDDFPSPVPSGEGAYITRDYGMDIRTFYTMIWWEDVRKLAKPYGIRYTGLVIEDYSDQVKAPFGRNNDATRYQYFGNMLLDAGGEIGFHGYNHMPLCLKNFDYQGKYDSYKHWESYEDMKAGLKELQSFCESLFPEERFRTYVPPSNILSEEGRTMLAEDFPDIKAIASVYLPGDLGYVQDFEVAEDGIVETPRVISGYIFDDYTEIAALSELNFHYVSSHFQHPDDVLDEDRGAEMGWRQMYQNLRGYVDWLYTAAPHLRSLTGVEMAGAVQRYDALQVHREETEHALNLTLDGFSDEAWLLVRINEGEPGAVTGGTLEKQLDGLYLLKAEEPEITIELIKTGEQGEGR